MDEQIPSEETVVQALEVGMPGQVGDKQGEEGLRSRVETTGEVGCGRILGAGSSSLQLTRKHRKQKSHELERGNERDPVKLALGLEAHVLLSGPPFLRRA